MSVRRRWSAAPEVADGGEEEGVVVGGGGGVWAGEEVDGALGGDGGPGHSLIDVCGGAVDGGGGGEELVEGGICHGRIIEEGQGITGVWICAWVWAGARGCSRFGAIAGRLWNSRG